MRSKYLTWLGATLLGCLLILGSCGGSDDGDDNPTGPTITSVAGQWNLSYNWNTGASGTAIWDLNSNGTFVTIEDEPGEGTWSLVEDRITVTYSTGAVYSGTVDVTSTSMQGTMTDPGGNGTWSATRVQN